MQSGIFPRGRGIMSTENTDTTGRNGETDSDAGPWKVTGPGIERTQVQTPKGLWIKCT